VPRRDSRVTGAGLLHRGTAGTGAGVVVFHDAGIRRVARRSLLSFRKRSEGLPRNFADSAYVSTT